MSYHFLDSKHHGDEVRLIIGWDAQSQSYFALIHSNEEPKAIEFYYADEFRNAPQTLEGLLEVFRKHWITLPPQMIDALERAPNNDDPNAVIEYFASGRSILHTNWRAHAPTEESNVTENMAALREVASKTRDTST